MLFAYLKPIRFIFMAVGLVVHTSDGVYGDAMTSKTSLDTNNERIDDKLMEVEGIFRVQFWISAFDCYYDIIFLAFQCYIVSSKYKIHLQAPQICQIGMLW